MQIFISILVFLKILWGYKCGKKSHFYHYYEIYVIKYEIFLYNIFLICQLLLDIRILKIIISKYFSRKLIVKSCKKTENGYKINFFAFLIVKFFYRFYLINKKFSFGWCKFYKFDAKSLDIFNLDWNIGFREIKNSVIVKITLQ